MSVEQKKVALKAIDKALIEGDFSSWDEQSRLDHLKRVCDSVGLNPLTKPFEFIKLNGKTQLYARKDATDQLRSVHDVHITDVVEKLDGDTFRVVVHAKLPNGRTDCDIGVVSVKGLNGDALANAQMKAFTKAKRRVTLSICGLGILDESELETIPDAQALKDITPQKTKLIGAKVETAKNAINFAPSNCTPHPDEKIKLIESIDYQDLMKWKTELSNAATMSSLQQVFGAVKEELKKKYPGNKEAAQLINKIKDECKAHIQEIDKL